MAISASFSVKNRADFVVGELIRFRAGGAVRLGLIRAINENGTLDLVSLTGGDPAHPFAVTYNGAGPFVSLGTEWIIEIIDGPETWVDNHEVGNTLGAIYTHANGRHMMVGHQQFLDNSAKMDLQTFEFVNAALPSYAVSLRWNLWLNEAQRRRPNGEPIHRHDAGVQQPA